MISKLHQIRFQILLKSHSIKFQKNYNLAKLIINIKIVFKVRKRKMGRIYL